MKKLGAVSLRFRIRSMLNQPAPIATKKYDNVIVLDEDIEAATKKDTIKKNSHN